MRKFKKKEDKKIEIEKCECTGVIELTPVGKNGNNNERVIF